MLRNVPKRCFMVAVRGELRSSLLTDPSDYRGSTPTSSEVSDFDDGGTNARSRDIKPLRWRATNRGKYAGVTAQAVWLARNPWRPLERRTSAQPSTEHTPCSINSGRREHTSQNPTAVAEHPPSWPSSLLRLC